MDLQLTNVIDWRVASSKSPTVKRQDFSEICRNQFNFLSKTNLQIQTGSQRNWRLKTILRSVDERRLTCNTIDTWRELMQKWDCFTVHFNEGDYINKAALRNSVALASLEVERVFNELANRWENETGHFSIVEQRVIHPLYQEIIGMGEKVVPFLIRELKKTPWSWFWALRAITRSNPVKKGATVQEAVEDWNGWWVKQNISYARVDFGREGKTISISE